MHSRRAILLASTALVGIGSLTVWQDKALAATVTFSGASTTAVDNPIIAASTPPDITVVADATALIDTKTGGAPLTVPATFNGTVILTNAGLIGLLPGDGGVLINGDPTKTTNNATATNNKTINGNLVVGAFGSRLGGTGTIVNNSAVSGNAIIWSLGNATLTSNVAGAIINGTVTVKSTDSGSTATVVGTVTTTSTVGGLASATIGDVGVPGGTKTHSNPDGFAGKSVTLFGITGASGTFSGHTGNVSITSYNDIFTSDTGTAVVAGGTSTLTTMSSEIDSGGPTSGTVLAGAQVLGNILLDSPGGSSLEIAGTVGSAAIPENKSGATPPVFVFNAVHLFPGSYDGSSTTETTVTKTSDSVLLSDTTVFQNFSDGGGATFTVDAGGQVNGTVLIQSDLAQTIVINGNTGKASQKFVPTVTTAPVDGSITLESDSFKDVETVTKTFNDVSGVGVRATVSDITTDVGNGGNISLTIGATGNVFGQATVNTGGGSFTLLVNGILGNSTVSKHALTANTSTIVGSGFGTVTTYDPTGAFPVLQVFTSSTSNTGGNFDLTVGSTGVVNGLVSVTAGDPTLLVDGTINGAVQLDAYGSTSLDTTTFTYDSKTGLLTNYVDVNNLNKNVSGPITATIDATGKIVGTLDLQTGAAVNVTIAGSVGNGVFDAVSNPNPTEGLFVLTTATDRTTTDTRVYNSTGTIITSQQLTDIQSATGGLVNVTIAAGGNIFGNVDVIADGPIVFTNNGGVERSYDATIPVPVLEGRGNVTLTTARDLVTQNNSSPIANNFTTTVTKDSAGVNIISTETVNKGSFSFIETTVGGALTIVNTSNLTIDGNLIGSALGNISFTNSGWVVGNVALTSRGTLFTETGASSTDNLIAFGDSTNPLIPTTQTVTIVPSATNFTEVFKDIGGSVTSTISGIVGVDNKSLDFAALKGFAGDHFLQVADTTSAITITSTGSVFMPVTSLVDNPGTFTETDKQTVVDVLNSVAYDQGKGVVGVLASGSMTIDTAFSETFVPATGTSSTVTVAGRVMMLPNGNRSDVTSQAPFGAIIADSGTVQGTLIAFANDTATNFSDVTHQVFTIDTSVVTDPLSANLGKPASTGKALESAFTDTQITTDTSAGGAATISLTGVGTAWQVDAEGTTGATVTIDPGAVVLQDGVYAEIVVNRDFLDTLTTTRAYSGTKLTLTITDTQSSSPAAVSAKANTLITQNGIVFGNEEADAGTGNATVLVNNLVRPAAGSSFGNGDITAMASINKDTSTFTAVVLGAKIASTTAAIKLTPSGVNILTVPVVIPGGDLGLASVPGVNTGGSAGVGAAAGANTVGLGIELSSKFSSKTTTVSAGGNAAITLTAPASVVAIGGASPNGILVTGNLFVNGDTSATVTNNAGSRVAGTTFIESLPQSFVGALQGLSNAGTTASPIFYPGGSTTESYNKLGNLDSRTLVTSQTYTGGTSLLTNAGELRNNITITSAGTSTFNNSGVAGTYNSNGQAASTWFTNPVFSSVNAIQTNFSTTVNDTGLTDPLTLAFDPTHGTSVTTQVWTPVGGTAAATNGGVIWGSIALAGGTGTLTNNGAIGSAFGSSGGSGAIFLGATVNNQTIVTTLKGNVTTPVETFAPLFNQTYTVNQNGIVESGIIVAGATIPDPLGFSAIPPNVDAFGNVKAVKTSNIVANINLNDKSITLDGVFGQMGVLDSDLATFYTTTNVNLGGNDWVGLNTAAFNVGLPATTAQQTQFLSSALGVSTNAFTRTAAFPNGNLELITGDAISGVTTLARLAGGTTYFSGVSYSNSNSPRLTDDVYAIRVTNFTLAATGEVQLALGDFDPTEGDDSANLFEAETEFGNVAPPASDIFGISGAVSNSGTLVIGARASETPPPNFGSFQVSAPLYIRGLTVRIDGSLTQSSTGALVVGVVPALVRVMEPAINQPTVGEILGTPGTNFTVPFFTTPVNSSIPVSTPSLILLSGNLNLAGTVVVAVDRNALYAANVTTPLIIDTPSIAPTTGVVSATAPTVSVTATATSSIPSSFVSFSLTTTTTGTGASTVTTVSLVTQRKSFSTGASTSNAAAAGHALDSDLTAIIPLITSDANGGATFQGVSDINNVQDLANIIASADFFLPAGQFGSVLDDLGNGGFYGSVRAFDTSRVLRDGFDVEAARATDMDHVGISLWATPIFRSTTLDGNSDIGTTDIDADEGGVTGGLDFRFTNHIGVGIGGGYTKNRLKAASLATADVDSWLIGGNAFYVDGPLLVTGQIDYARSNYSVDRHLPTMSRDAHAEFGGTEFRGQLAVAYTFYDVAADGNLTPYIAIDLRRADTHAFSESGAGGVSLVVDGKSDNVVDPRIGLRWDGSAWGTPAFTVKPVLDGSYTFSNDMNTSATMHFAGGEDVIATRGIQGKGYGTIQLGVVGSIGDNGTLGITGGFDFGGGRTATSISANFRHQW